MSLGSLLLAGCGGVVGVPLGGSTGPTPAEGSLTGNWQIAATTTSGAAPFTALSGSIVQEAPAASGATTLISVLQAVNPGTCYLGQSTIPSEGSLATSSFSLTSFSVDGQYLTISGAPANPATSFSGTFSVSGGCADGTHGSVSGIQIAPMTGTYTGTLSAAATSVALTLTQDDTSDGLGYFHVHGTASFTGLSCFTSGTLNSTGSIVSGQQVTLAIQTNESPSSTVIATGTLTPSAAALTLSSVQVTSGGCQGNQGGGSLSE